jgi:formaldehyde-activating enzyme
MTELWFRTGQATVLASEGQATDAMPEILLGSVRGPVGQAFATLMGQSAGHTRLFVLRDLNEMVRPPALMTSRVTIQTPEYAELFGGVVQAALGDAILDSVMEGVFAGAVIDDLCMIITVWLDPRAAEDPNLDRYDLYRTNYEATRLALYRAVHGEPTIETLAENRKTVKHVALDGVIDYA